MEKDLEEELAMDKQNAKLLALIRDIKYGELRIIVNDGKPIRVEEVRKSIKL